MVTATFRDINESHHEISRKMPAEIVRAMEENYIMPAEFLKLDKKKSALILFRERLWFESFLQSLMRKPLIYLLVFLVFVAPATGQQYLNNSPGELRMLLQKSKPDTNRILLLYELGRTYFKQIYSDNKGLLLDTAIGIFNDAINLSDSLQQYRFKYEAILLQGEAYFLKGNLPEGKKRFLEIVSTYHGQADIEREARTWMRLGKKLIRQTDNFTEIQDCFYKAIQLYREVGKLEKMADVRTQLADHYFVQLKLNMAENESLEALELYKQAGYNKLYNTYFMLSVINRYKAEFDKSLLYATKCVQNIEETKDTSLAYIFYGELALVYEELGRIQESINWYERALEKRKAIKTTPVVVIYRTAGFLVRQLIKQNKPREALELINGLINDYPPESSLEKATVTQNKAYCLDALNQFSNAEKYFLDMLMHYEKAAYRDEYHAMANIDVGRFYLNRNEFAKAHFYLKKALLGLNLPSSRRTVYQLLFKADSATGNYLSAIRNLQQHQIINDSIFNEKKSRQIEELQIQYETAKKEKEIILLNTQNKEQKVRSQKSSMVRNYIISAILILLGFLYFRYRLKQKSNIKLQAQQREINQKNHSLEHLVKEKEWLVKEIHHRVKNNFHIVMGLLGTQSGYLKNEEAIKAMSESQHRVHAMSLIHQKLYQTDNLSAINMSGYIHELIDYLRDSFNIRQSIQFNLRLDPIELGLSHCIPLGLIINEAITNSIKYAFPDNRDGIIDISFKQRSARHVLLVIQDTGVGLPPAFYAENFSDSMGMRLMQGLSDDIDGKLSIRNNNGTEIILDFVYDPEINIDVTQIKAELTNSV